MALRFTGEYEDLKGKLAGIEGEWRELNPNQKQLRTQDGAVLNWLAPGDVATVAPYVHAAGPGKELAARIFVAATGDLDQARAMGHRALAAYLNVPVYRAFHEWLGRGERLAPMWEAWAAGDRRGAVAAIPDDVVDDLVVHGPPEACRERLQQYAEAGVHTPILALMPAGGDVGATVRALGPAAG